MPHKRGETLRKFDCLSKFMGKVAQEVRGKPRNKLARDSSVARYFAGMRRHEPLRFFQRLRDTGFGVDERS